MINQFLKIANVSNIDDFYAKYPTESHFFAAHPEAAAMLKKAEGGIHLDPSKKGTFTAQATRMGMSTQEAASHILANKEDYSPEMVKKAVFAHNFAKEFGGMIAHDTTSDDLEIMAEGGIPQRYKNMGFTHVGQKKEGDGQHKWKVLAKKGDKYKVVQGGYRGMEDFHQHHNEKRRKRFWDRMGGRDSAKANDPFSPLYWHKRFGTWAEGGELDYNGMFFGGANHELPQAAGGLQIPYRPKEAPFVGAFANFAPGNPAFDKMAREAAAKQANTTTPVNQLMTPEGYIANDYIENTDYTNTVRNLQNNKFNQGLAGANVLTDPRSMMWALPEKSILRGVAGLASGLAGTTLGYEKLFSGGHDSNLYNDRTSEYGPTDAILKMRKHNRAGAMETVAPRDPSTFAAPLTVPKTIPTQAPVITPPAATPHEPADPKFKFNPSMYPSTMEDYSATSIDPGADPFRRFNPADHPEVPGTETTIAPTLYDAVPARFNPGMYPPSAENPNGLTIDEGAYRSRLFNPKAYPPSAEDKTLSGIDRGVFRNAPDPMTQVQITNLGKFLPGYTPAAVASMLTGFNMPANAQFAYTAPAQTTPQVAPQVTPQVPVAAPAPASAPVAPKVNNPVTLKPTKIQTSASTQPYVAPVIPQTQPYNYNVEGEMPNGNVFTDNVPGSLESRYGQPGSPSYSDFNALKQFLPKAPADDVVNDVHRYDSKYEWEQRHPVGPVADKKLSNPNGENVTIGNYTAPITIDKGQIPYSAKFMLDQVENRFNQGETGLNANQSGNEDQFVVYDSSTGNAYMSAIDPDTQRPVYRRIERPNPGEFTQFDPHTKQYQPVTTWPTDGGTYMVTYRKPAQQPSQPDGFMQYGGLHKMDPGGTNKVLTANNADPNANKTNTGLVYQELWRQETPGDTLGTQMAMNALSGFQMFNDMISARKNQREYDKAARMTGNTDFAAQSANPVNPFGTYTPNAGPGNNFSLSTSTPMQDFGTKGIAAKYGGMKSYREGGTYVLSPAEIREILANGGEIEFLD